VFTERIVENHVRSLLAKTRPAPGQRRPSARALIMRRST
jgi:hypothetical protein